MRFVIQRVNHAKCTIDGNITGSIEKGLCVLIGIAETDTKEIADKMIKKLINMRIFADENDKTNLSIIDYIGLMIRKNKEQQNFLYKYKDDYGIM